MHPITENGVPCNIEMSPALHSGDAKPKGKTRVIEHGVKRESHLEPDARRGCAMMNTGGSQAQRMGEHCPALPSRSNMRTAVRVNGKETRWSGDKVVAVLSSVNRPGRNALSRHRGGHAERC